MVSPPPLLRLACALITAASLATCSGAEVPESDPGSEAAPTPTEAAAAGAGEEDAATDAIANAGPDTAAGDAPPSPALDATPSAHTSPAAEAILDADADADADPWTAGTGHAGVHTLAWRPLGGHARIPRNVECELELRLTRGDEPVGGAHISLTGWMPAHSHGLVQIPLIEEQGEGLYRVSGLLLHMRGQWQLRFSVLAERSMETVTFELEL